MGSFTQGLINFKVKTEKQASQVVRKLVLDMFAKLIVTPWPVETGRSKANNQISLNDLPTTAVLTLDKDGSATIAVGLQVLSSFKLGDTIFLYNNVEYALALEYGHSKQAPAGCYRIAVQNVIATYGGGAA